MTQVIEHLVRFKLIALCLIIWGSFTSIYSQTYPDSSVNRLLKSGINNLIIQQYDKAKSDFTELDNLYPNLPFGKIYLAALQIVKAYDFGNEYDSKKIEGLLNLARKKAEVLLDEDKTNIWNQYFIALCDGYYSYYKALNSSWWPAFSNGVSSVESFQKCLQMDPKFYEAYAAIGSFKYWKSRKTDFLNWLPFVSNDEEDGIRMLKIAANHSSYHSYLALNSLIWIYIDKKDYKTAAAYADTALKSFPNSRYFLWGLGRAYEDLNPAKAIEIYQKILNSYTDIQKANRYNEVILKYILAKMYDKIGDKKRSLRYCNDVLNLSDISDRIKEKLGDRIDKVKELKKELSK